MNSSIRLIPIIISFSSSFFILNHFSIDPLEYNFLEIHGYFLLSFFLSSALTQKYVKNYSEDLIELLNPYLKSYILLLFSLLLLDFFIIINDLNIALELMKWYIITELILLVIIFSFNLFFNLDNIEYVQKEINDNTLSGQMDKITHKSLKTIEEMDFSSVYQSEMLDVLRENLEGVEISNIPSKNNVILLTDNKLNKIKKINSFLTERYQSVNRYKICIFFYDDLVSRSKKIRFKKLDFLIHTIIPFIPLLNKIYFNFLSYPNRTLSRAETWGRLHFSGFEVNNELKLKDGFAILAIKKYAPSPIKSPSYYPIIRLERVGQRGKKILIYKIRTMYPYSEFIQKKVFEMSSLSKSGKFKDDFRITRIGRILRKTWLDELPQILDWLRGDIKLVGIRAMSLHYFSLYPSSYQEKYYSVKPGILSPIFDENSSSFRDIVKIEEDYLTSYIRRPIYTDVIYFFRTLNDIIFKGVRSS